MKVQLIISGLFLVSFLSCKKDNSSNTKTFIDTVSVTRYYPVDSVPTKYSSIYNKWKLTKITGGFAGTKVIPSYVEYLYFKKNGIYCFTVNDTLKGFGKINIVNTTNNLTISYTPDKLSGKVFSEFETQVDLLHSDTLYLINPCCDLYTYEFVKQ
jgi:hypothetical protein